jgi:hypothetical protein
LKVDRTLKSLDAVYITVFVKDKSEYTVSLNDDKIQKSTLLLDFKKDDEREKTSILLSNIDDDR